MLSFKTGKVVLTAIARCPLGDESLSVTLSESIVITSGLVLLSTAIVLNLDSVLFKPE